MMDLPETYRDILRRLLKANPPDGEFAAQFAIGGGGGKKLQPKGASGHHRPDAIPVSDGALAELVRLGFLHWQVPDRHGYVTLAGKRAATGESTSTSGSADDPSPAHQTEQSRFPHISDSQLRERCQDLLAASDHYDRAVREACVILEDRVRSVSGADKTDIGSDLMAKAFRPNGGLLRLSSIPAEQVGAMELYRGTMSFFRNATGHHLVDTWTQEDAARFIGWIDLLLKILGQAEPSNAPARAE